MIKKELLERLYISDKKSMQEIADLLGFSVHKIAYWIEKHKIKSRPRSEAMYVKHNPKGDPFSFRKPKTLEEGILFGMGLGLYWGEGTKASKNSVRLGNTDPKLLAKFIEFLETFYDVKRRDMKFGLQIFNDMNPQKTLDFWMKSLRINSAQFNKIIVTKSGSIGTYRKKTEYGVLTVMFHNTKLRNLIVATLPM